MKKTTVVLLLLLAMLPLAASDEGYIFKSPLEGAYAVPMDSPVYWGLGKWDGIKEAWIDAGPQYLWEHKSDLDGKVFADWHMIALLGCQNVHKDYYNDVLKLRVTVTSPAGLNFVSLGNPNISRPYKITFSSNWREHGKDGSNRHIYTVENNGDPVEFEIGNGYGNSNFDAWMDVILILPGELPAENKAQGIPSLANNEDEIISNGVRYKLIDADDYSSVVFMDIEVLLNDKVILKDTLTIPISGFYDSGNRQSALMKSNRTFGMHVRPTAYCSNLDLNAHQGVPLKIASLNLVSSDIMPESYKDITYDPAPGPNPPPAPGPEPPAPVGSRGVMHSEPEMEDYYWGGDYYGDLELWNDYASKKSAWDSKEHEYRSYISSVAIRDNEEDHRMYVFLSSSPDPFTPGDRFMLVHDHMPPNEPPNIRMSLPYNLLLIDQDDPQNVQVYDGTKAVSASENLADDKDLMHSHPRYSGKSHSINRWFHDLNADVMIIIDNIGSTLVKGRYEDKIYVHVVGPNQ